MALVGCGWMGFDAAVEDHPLNGHWLSVLLEAILSRSRDVHYGSKGGR